VIEAIVLAFGLSMDATAISVARGISKTRERFAMPLVYGVAHVFAFTAGWIAGETTGAWINNWDHWIAFVLLLGIGSKMILDTFRTADDESVREGTMLYLSLTVATSIDAIAAGFTLPLLGVAPWIAIATLGVVVTACSALGYYLGRHAGKRLGPRLQWLGGLVLIAIAIRILVEHALGSTGA
jgi:putative Mn2+ efflux pump MntP